MGPDAVDTLLKRAADERDSLDVILAGFPRDATRDAASRALDGDWSRAEDGLASEVKRVVQDVQKDWSNAVDTLKGCSRDGTGTDPGGACRAVVDDVLDGGPAEVHPAASPTGPFVTEFVSAVAAGARLASEVKSDISTEVCDG